MTLGPIFVYDGDCALCSATVRFVLAHERDQALKFCAIQSAAGRQIAARAGVDPDAPATFLLVEAGEVFARSDGALRLAARLKAPWRWARIAAALPRAWRDGLYDWVAGNRFRIWGRTPACMVSLPGAADRFL